ncbi:MAG: hypothetical protein LBI18_00375 [Planctomycetaceae bacterium]|jgi:hypothetical protein|nr:hypothetical protein [Planctomycetaceae bacterium]
MMTFNIRSVCFFFVLVLPLTGCNFATQTYSVTGTVNYDGQPLAQGMITLTPDGVSGNSGKSSMAEIRNGSFSVPKKYGVTGGAYRIFVESVESLGGEDAGSKELFPTFSMDYHFPEGANPPPLTIDIPKTSKKK